MTALSFKARLTLWHLFAVLVILAATLARYNLPLEGVTLILGVDTLMDMGRTTMNVVGNCMAAAVIARTERALPS